MPRSVGEEEERKAFSWRFDDFSSPKAEREGKRIEVQTMARFSLTGKMLWLNYLRFGLFLIKKLVSFV